MVLTVSVEVRFADLDAYGHVNNAVYFTYLETARTKLFMEDFREFMKAGLTFLVVKAECEYKKPISLTSAVYVDIELIRSGRSSFDIEYRIHDNNGTLYAGAKTVMVCFDSTLNKPVKVPEAMKAMFKHRN